ncbi:MAG TPA: T9SS type A sorting domain-containing protein [Candidatus Kapabacteria bacterium]|nr:T9SS type A sorting domain-containing protein [Candidatus Kapabacteria bacterium]
MRVDESKGLLSVYGDFGSQQGKVFCDSVELNITSWNDTIVIAGIPDSGRGSAGPVVVEVDGNRSIERKISLWEGIWIYSYTNPQDHQWDWRTDSLRFVIRFEMVSLSPDQTPIFGIKLSQRSTYQVLGSTGSEGYHGDGEETVIQNKILPINLRDTDYNTGFRGICTLEPKEKTIRVDISDVKGIETRHSIYESGHEKSTDFQPYKISDFSFLLPLDSNYSVKSQNGYDDPVFYKKTIIIPLRSLFIPTPEILSLQRSPQLVSPKNASEGLGPAKVILYWQSMPYMNSYRVQYSNDSLFTQSLIDTIWTIQARHLPELLQNTSYFWRVAGINAEGQSKWSEVWKFTTENVASVASNQSLSHFSVYPNPAKDILNLSSSLKHCYFALYNLQGVLLKLFDPDVATIDVSSFSAGNYILGTVAGSQSYSTIVSIVR